MNFKSVTKLAYFSVLENTISNKKNSNFCWLNSDFPFILNPWILIRIPYPRTCMNADPTSGYFISHFSVKICKGKPLTGRLADLMVHRNSCNFSKINANVNCTIWPKLTSFKTREFFEGLGCLGSFRASGRMYCTIPRHLKPFLWAQLLYAQVCFSLTDVTVFLFWWSTDVYL